MLIALCDFWFNSSTFLRWNCPWITGTHLKRSECLSVAKHNRFKTSVSNLIHLFCSLEQYAGIFLLYCGIEHKSGAHLLVSFQDEIALFVKNYEPFYGLIHEKILYLKFDASLLLQSNTKKTVSLVLLSYELHVFVS